jgi:repressor of nif and glnA expression
MIISEQLREILKVIAKLSNEDINAGVMNTLIYKRLPNFPENEIDYKLNELASLGFISTSPSTATSTKTIRSDKLCHITSEGLDAIGLSSNHMS